MGDMFTVCTLTNLFGAFYPGVFAGTRGTSKSMNERHTSCTMLNGITLLAVAVGEAEGRGTGLESASVGALLPAFKDFIFEKTSSDKSIRGEKMIPLLSDALQHAYHAVDDMFKQPGCKDEASEYLPRCTLTAVLVDPEFGFAFLQLGDCFAMLIDAATGEIKWQTEQHDFTNSRSANVTLMPRRSLNSAHSSTPFQQREGKVRLSIVVRRAVTFSKKKRGRRCGLLIPSHLSSRAFGSSRRSASCLLTLTATASLRFSWEPLV